MYKNTSLYLPNTPPPPSTLNHVPTFPLIFFVNFILSRQKTELCIENKSLQFFMFFLMALAALEILMMITIYINSFDDEFGKVYRSRPRVNWYSKCIQEDTTSHVSRLNNDLWVIIVEWFCILFFVILGQCLGKKTHAIGYKSKASQILLLCHPLVVTRYVNRSIY